MCFLFIMKDAIRRKQLIKLCFYKQSIVTTRKKTGSHEINNLETATTTISSKQTNFIAKFRVNNKSSSVSARGEKWKKILQFIVPIGVYLYTLQLLLVVFIDFDSEKSSLMLRAFMCVMTYRVIFKRVRALVAYVPVDLCAYV